MSRPPTAAAPTHATPLIRVLLLDFSPTKIADLWHAAIDMLPAIEVRMYCRSHRDLEGNKTLADHYDVILVDAEDHEKWFSRLERPALKSLLLSTVVIAGTEALYTVQASLLRGGYADVVCVQDVHARTIVTAAIRAYLRQLRARQIELPAAIAAPIQKALM